jgi:hypothetical protein
VTAGFAALLFWKAGAFIETVPEGACIFPLNNNGKILY